MGSNPIKSAKRAPKDHKRSSKGAYMGVQKRHKAVSNYASIGMMNSLYIE